MSRPIPRSRWTAADYMSAIAHICYEGWLNAKGQRTLNLKYKVPPMEPTFESETQSVIAALRSENTPEADAEAEMLATVLDDLRHEVREV